MCLKYLRLARRFCVLFTLFLIANVAGAGDIASMRRCVKLGYEAMPDRGNIVVAVLDGMDSEILTFGGATSDQLFEIGSVTKTFTATLLAQSVLENSLKLSDPIPAVYQKKGSTITYQHLATHTSGIRAGNFPSYTTSNPLAPYEGMTLSIFKDLYDKTPLVSDPGQIWSYSNLGVSLLGLILSEKADLSYEELVRKKIFAPLGMNDSYFHMPDQNLSRFRQGSVIINKSVAAPAPFWDLSSNALNPAGGIRSSIGDMILYARANLVSESSSLAEAVKLSQQPIYQVKPGTSMGMNWMIYPETGVVWHHGATGGFNAIIALSKKHNQAVVALANSASYLMDSQGNPDIDMTFHNVAINCLRTDFE